MQCFPQLPSLDLINLISQSFDFELIDPPLPQFSKLGKLRIVGVIINELQEPELCLLDEQDPRDHVNIYPISHLKVDLRYSIAA